MLTGDLVCARVRKGDVVPSLVAADDEELGDDARWLCGLFAEGVKRGVTRGELEEAVAEEARIRPDHKRLRGLAKVMFDRGEFATGAPSAEGEMVDPILLRDRVFRASAKAGPLALGEDVLGRPTTRSVLEAVGLEFGLSAEQVRDGLYADRKEEQRLTSCEVPAPEGLIDRYNLALVQSLLLRATKLTVTLETPTAPRVRQLLRHAKFHQLMHRAWREGDLLHLEVDGPESVLKQSTRYGLKLASFLPAVLLQERWSLVAEVIWGKARKRLAVDGSTGLKTTLVDRGAYVTREAGWFKERFEALGCDWTLEEGSEPIDLGGRAVVMPDFTLRRAGRVAHLEIIGVWRKDYLERRVEWLRAYGPGNLILAVSRKLVADGSALADLGLEVVPFAEVVPARQVLDAAERVAR